MKRDGNARRSGTPWVIGPATPSDLMPVLALLEALGLPDAGLAQHRSHLLVARVGEEVIGSAALEIPGSEDAALLRSVATQNRFRGQGLGSQLTDAALEHARQQGVGRLYLLTESAQGFFERFGFRLTDRASAPLALRRSMEFTTACPASAACMTRVLSSPG